MVGLLWATRGRTWGFRFLLDGGYAQPLSTYETAFRGAMNGASAVLRSGDLVAVKFLDPEGREDRSGRPIPHEFVVSGRFAREITSQQDALRLLWPLVAEAYTAVWNEAAIPDPATVRALVSPAALDLP